MIKRVDVNAMFGVGDNQKIEDEKKSLEQEEKELVASQYDLLKNFHQLTKRVIEDLNFTDPDVDENSFTQLNEKSKCLQRVSGVLKNMFQMEQEIFTLKKQLIPDIKDRRITRVDLHIMLDACREFGFIREGCENDIPRILDEFEKDGCVTPYPYNAPPPDWETNKEKYQDDPIACLDEFFEQEIKKEDAKFEWEFLMEKQLRERRLERERKYGIKLE